MEIEPNQDFNQLDKDIRENCEYLQFLKYDQFPNIQPDQSKQFVKSEYFFQLLVELIYLFYSASKKKVSVVIPQKNIVFRTTSKGTKIFIYYSYSKKYNSQNASQTIVQTIFAIVNKLKQRSSSSDESEKISKSLNEIKQIIHKSKTKPIQQLVEEFQRLYFFDEYSTLKKIQNSMLSVYLYILHAKKQKSNQQPSNTPKQQSIHFSKTIQDIKEQTLNIRANLDQLKAIQVAKQLAQKFKPYGIQCMYISEQPIPSSYTIRMHLIYVQKKILHETKANKNKDLLGAKSSSHPWNIAKFRFLLEISPQQRVICVKLLTPRSDKVDHIDQNIYRMNLFTFEGNLVSFQSYRLQPKQQDGIYSTIFCEVPAVSRIKYYFALKTSTDIGNQGQNFRKLIMVMDYLVASWKAVETFFQKSVNESEQNYRLICDIMSHYQQIALKTLVRLFQSENNK